MKTKLFILIVPNVIFFCFFITQIQADMLTGEQRDKSSTGKFQYDDETEKHVYLSPMSIRNHTTGKEFTAFCGDFRVNTSSSFGTTGQAYNSYSLNSSELTVYSDLQKAAIDTLFGNVYSSAFALDGNMTNTLLGKAMQVCLWEILTETSGTFDLTSGDFLSLPGLDAATAEMCADFLAALNGEISWDSLGFDYTQYEYEVWVAEGGMSASQTLINVKDPVTPEPATVAVMGVGIAALMPLFKRKQKRKSCDAQRENDCGYCVDTKG